MFGEFRGVVIVYCNPHSRRNGPFTDAKDGKLHGVPNGGSDLGEGMMDTRKPRKQKEEKKGIGRTLEIRGRSSSKGIPVLGRP